MTSLKTILYFSIFEYPITKEEILKYSDGGFKEDIEKELNALLKDRIIYKMGEYYYFTNSPETVQKRITGNEMAKKVIPKANKMANKIAQFPFVKGVAFSGAFSKGYFDAEGDIDFFIITAENRLWLTRTILILYKKIFLLNSKRYFCVNYFISEKYLNIAEKNKFTAMEIATLVPTHGKSVFSLFFKSNKWTNQYFPNVNTAQNLNSSKEIKPNKLKRGVEWILNSKLGEFLEYLFFRITLKKWYSKFNYLSKEDFNVAMKSAKNVSKHHPNNYQKFVIERLNLSYQHIQEKHNIKLDPEHL